MDARAVNMIEEITGMLNNIQYRKLSTPNMGELEEVHDIVSQLDKRTIASNDKRRVD